MVDYRINLAKSLTSSMEERMLFRKRMFIYLGVCSVLLIGVVYTSTANLRKVIDNGAECNRLLTLTSAIDGFDQSTFEDPEKAYADLQAHSGRINTLKLVLEQRVSLIPIIYNLFIDLSPEVALQSLSCNKEKLSFGITVPEMTQEAGDPVRKLKAKWESNEELMARVASIRPITGERRAMGSESVFFVQFECGFKK